MYVLDYNSVARVTLVGLESSANIGIKRSKDPQNHLGKQIEN